MLNKTLLMLLSLFINMGAQASSSPLIQNENGSTGFLQTGSQMPHNGVSLTNAQLESSMEVVRANLMANATNPEEQHVQQMLDSLATMDLNAGNIDAQKKTPSFLTRLFFSFITSTTTKTE
ncbi:hypothetical protein [Candidatus Finniella inopinata]|uniref:Uncharacterized protein n=1 Tax=Candidatus Finniella inopinata TaxID=1696036 RepID=A0A4Q7DGP6_9PROT|nr:hypothetical protein [Candidatus Finniella inopinata]RZI46061.1 hypothetical protein EQU50_03770 [Candidatus Finniella inopinata]